MDVNLSADRVRVSMGAISLGASDVSTGRNITLSARSQTLFSAEDAPSITAVSGASQPSRGSHLFVGEGGSYTTKGTKISDFHVGELGCWEGDIDRQYYGVVQTAEQVKHGQYVVSYSHKGCTYAKNMWAEHELWIGRTVGLSLGLGIDSLALIAWVDEEPPYTGMNDEGVPITKAVFTVAEYTAPQAPSVKLVL